MLPHLPNLTGINRIRLEFKDNADNTADIRAVPVLIESDWNLKYKSNVDLWLEKTVLIESDWNLKIQVCWII